LFNIDEFLAARGLRVDEVSRIKLIEQVAIALVLGAETLKRRAHGDYGLDEVVKRFPPWKEKEVRSLNGSHTRLADLLEGWAKESNPAQSTIDLWRSHVAGFMSYIGNDDARSIQCGDVIKWKQHLIELGNTPKTINDSKLAALKTIFRWAVENEVVPHNPATGVTIRRTKKSGERMLGFEPEEAATILKAAAKQTNPAYRWVPLLCAQSGARVSEICQLRREDIRFEERIWFMHLRPEAGALKTAGSERKVHCTHSF
jgi:integrase